MRGMTYVIAAAIGAAFALAFATIIMAANDAAEQNARNERKLLAELRDECRDWQDALSGEREGFDELCQRIDAVLNRQVSA
jgi:hypothetical protein